MDTIYMPILYLLTGRMYQMQWLYQLCRGKKVTVEFELDRNYPYSKWPLRDDARDMEPVVRQYMALHYSESFDGKRMRLFILNADF